MFTKRDRTARLLRVANLLFQHPHGLTAPRIAELIDMNVRTVYRDLRAIEAEVGVPIWQEGNRYGAERTSLLPPLKLTLHEAVTLFLSARLMQRFQDHRDPHVISAFNKLATILPSPIAQHVHATVAWLNERAPDDTRTQIFDLIATAWAESRKVKIRYPSKHHQTDERVIAPYFIEPNPGGHSRYVIAHDSASNEVRTFKIERIDHAELTADTFDIPQDFDVANRLRHAWGISDEETVHVRLRFLNAAAAQRVLETNWHASQQLIHEPDGSLLMTLEVGGLLEITPWLLGWGSAIEVLSPPELRETIRQTAGEMSTRYIPVPS